MDPGYVFTSINEWRNKMRNLLILITLLTLSACAPLQVISQVTQIPIATAAATEPPTPVVINSGTAEIQCPCPGGVFPPGQSQGGVIGGTPIICNCPAALLPPTISATDVEPTTQTIPPSGVTLDDNGKTFILHPGDSFLLDLGTDTFDWTVNIDAQDVLSREKNVMVIRGAQGIYLANKPGQAILTAVGDPLCRNSIPACAAPSLLFRITLIVQ